MTTMLNIESRGRRVLMMAATVAVALAGTACDLKDTLLEPQQPGLIKPGDLQSATGAEAVRTGALERLQRATLGGNNNQESIWLLAGLMTDEFKSSDTFSQRNETDQRNIQTNNAQIQSEYTTLQQLRGYARDAANYLKEFVPEKPAEQAQMFFAMGFAELQLSEDFCNGIPFGVTVDGVPHYTPPVSTAEGFALARAHFDSALTLITGTDAFSVGMKQAILVAKARTLIDLGLFTEAANTVPAAAVPDSFQYNLTYSQSSGQDNEWWIMTLGTARYAVGDSVDLIAGATNRILNAIPFASLKDPRVPNTGSSVTGTAAKGFDGQTVFITQNLWGRDDPVPLVSGIDARLVEAEARLQAADYAGMMAILNALRTSPRTIGIFKVPAMTALSNPTPTTKAEAADIFFREKALWQFGRGQRMGDLRRLVRQYGRPQDQAFPAGNFFKNGTYGTDVNFPVTDNEKSNPNFTKCIDRNA